MDINKVTHSDPTQRYATQSPKVVNKQESSEAKASDVKDKVEISQEALAAATSSETKVNEQDDKKKAFSIVKMSDEARAELVEKLKEEQQQNTAKLIDFVRNTVAKQGTTFAQTDDVWKFIASGEYEVDAQTKAEAQVAISEDGYYGVKKTSERLFEFALALTGGDEELMRKMEGAVGEGFRLATEAWGRELPSITEDTHEAIKQKFNDYYESLKQPETNDEPNNVQQSQASAVEK